MKLFKSSHSQWMVVVENQAEKRRLFQLIPKRDRQALYFYPDGTKHEQFAISVEEADRINDAWKTY